jgi:hypothetical protein
MRPETPVRSRATSKPQADDIRMLLRNSQNLVLLFQPMSFCPTSATACPTFPCPVANVIAAGTRTWPTISRTGPKHETSCGGRHRDLLLGNRDLASLRIEEKQLFSPFWSILAFLGQRAREGRSFGRDLPAPSGRDMTFVLMMGSEIFSG